MGDKTFNVLLAIGFVVFIGYQVYKNKDNTQSRKSESAEYIDENSIIESNGNVNVKALGFNKEEAKTVIREQITQEVSELNSIGNIYFSDTDFKNVKNAKVTIRLTDNSSLIYSFIVTNDPLSGYSISNIQIDN